jgi:hypothetical protein
MDTLCITIIDLRGRSIEIGHVDQHIVAEHNKVRIAEWTFAEYDRRMLLGVAEMDEDYENAGIGTAMWREAEELHSDFAIADHFTNSGAKFFKNRFERRLAVYDHEEVYDPRF